MLKSKQVVWHVKRKTMRSVYIDPYELLELMDWLKFPEIRLYAHIVALAIKDTTPDDFSTKTLAKALNASESTIKNARAGLSKKGYLIIRKFKDESGDPMVRVVVGRDQVTLYNLGLKVEITDAKAYRELVKQFDFDNPKLTKEAREKAVKAANEHYMKSTK